MDIPSEKLPKWERLCRRIAIDKLFSQGKSLKVYPLRLIYLRVTEQDARQAILPSLLDMVTEVPRIQVLFSVPKRNIRKAVHRNLVKRRLRESFRRNKANLSFAEPDYYIVAVVYMAKEAIAYAELDYKLNEALLRLPSTTATKPIF